MERLLTDALASITIRRSKFYCYGVAAEDLEEVVLTFQRRGKDLGITPEFSIKPVISKVRTLFTVAFECTNASLEAILCFAETCRALLRDGLIRF